eukprot:scaffold762_cov121-Isochrysis_galbana.AAC.3
MPRIKFQPSTPTSTGRSVTSCSSARKSNVGRSGTCGGRWAGVETEAGQEERGSRCNGWEMVAQQGASHETNCGKGTRGSAASLFEDCPLGVG